MDSKKLSIGTEDFEKLRLSDSVYIDKTSYLTELYGEHVHSNGMSYVDEVLLFTRPRRFGKSLTMSMIKNFFELNYADPEDKSKPKQIFRNLAISRNKAFCEKYMGQFPVISISLKDVEGETVEGALNELLGKIYELYDGFRSLLDCNALAPEDHYAYQYVLSFTKQSSRLWDENYFMVL